MNAPDVIAIDFETHPIGHRPHYPPKPVGVAIQWPQERAPRYYGWGHPTNNNSSFQGAMAALQAAWDSGLPLLFHHSKFDVAVACEALGAPWPAWDRVHDSMLLAYLCDPHARSLGLKPLAADWLQWPADEKNVLDTWIWDHRAQLEQAYGLRVKKSELGAWIWAAPGDIVRLYANGDIARTLGLWQRLWPLVQQSGMGGAYDRERELQPLLMENERTGMRVAAQELAQDVGRYTLALGQAETWLRKELRAGGLNFDADQDVAAILLDRGIVPPDKWSRTKATKAHPNGVLAVNKEALLPEYFTDWRIASALGYRNRLVTCLKMFMEPWLAQAQRRSGYISTEWNQVRNPQGGTRTGRPSTSNPNFLNLSKDFTGRDDGYRHPDFLQLPALPLVRNYILPDDGGEFLHRDFDGQELRLFAHFEQGDLWRKYRENPELDPHKFVGSELMRVAGRDIERTKVKVLNFQALYGGGIPALQRKLRCSLGEAKELKNFHNAALPGRKILDDELKAVGRLGLPIRTWGGRLYYPEPPRVVDGQRRAMDYKLINYEIQGSAADLTKQTLVDWMRGGGASSGVRFMITVYDEINLSAPHDVKRDAMAFLKEVMERPRLTVPMRSSPKHGETWGGAKKCQKESGCQLCL